MSNSKSWIFQLLFLCELFMFSTFDASTLKRNLSTFEHFWCFEIQIETFPLVNFLTLRNSNWNPSTCQLFVSDFSTSCLNVLSDWNHAPPLYNPRFRRLVLQAQQSQHQDGATRQNPKCFWEWRTKVHLLNLRELSNPSCSNASESK